MYQHLSSSPFGPERIAAKKRAKKVSAPKGRTGPKPAPKPKPVPKPAPKKHTQQKAKKRTAKDRLWPEKWHSGAWWPKVPPHRMPGAEKFTHIIRSPDDPEPLSREQRRTAGVGTESWKKAGQGTAVWKKQIMSVLKKSKKPITFNAIVVLATNGKFTADIVAGEDADAALWELVAEGKIEHTAQAPILFRVRR